MRILHAIDSSGLYGAEAVLLTLAEEQRRRGDTPVILSMGGVGVAEKAIENEAQRRHIECEAMRMSDGLNFALARRIVAIAHAHRADVIHSHGYKANILLGLLSRAERELPVVTTLHGWTAKRTFSKLGLYRFLDQRVLSWLDGVVLVNDAMRGVRAVARLDRPAVTIPNGIALGPPTTPDPAVGDAIARLRERCSIVFGVVGRLSPEKNVAGLVAALAELGRDARVGLAVLGAGPEQARIEADVARFGLSNRVVLTGYVANARSALPLLDALVIPSFTEGLPMILLESLAASVPVIATRVGDIPAVLADDGLLVPPGDRAALADALRAVAGDLPSVRERARRAAARISRDYSSAAMAERYAQVYATAVKR